MKIVSKLKANRKFYGGIPYWAPFDLLRLFKLTLGPTPLRVEKRNFLSLGQISGTGVALLTGALRPHGCIAAVCWKEDSASIFLPWCVLRWYRKYHARRAWTIDIRNSRYLLAEGKTPDLLSYSSNESCRTGSWTGSPFATVPKHTYSYGSWGMLIVCWTIDLQPTANQATS